MICPYCPCNDRCGRESFWIPDHDHTPVTLETIPGGRSSTDKKKALRAAKGDDDTKEL